MIDVPKKTNAQKEAEKQAKAAEKARKEAEKAAKKQRKPERRPRPALRRHPHPQGGVSRRNRDQNPRRGSGE